MNTPQPRHTAAALPPQKTTTTAIGKTSPPPKKKKKTTTTTTTAIGKKGTVNNPLGFFIHTTCIACFRKCPLSFIYVLLL